MGGFGAAYEMRRGAQSGMRPRDLFASKPGGTARRIDFKPLIGQDSRQNKQTSGQYIHGNS
jgi:hypothetical protein